MSIETLFEEASERKVESLTDGNIKDISNLCQELLVLQGKIGSKEQELKTLKQKEKELSEQIIPSKLEEFGVLDIKLADGSRISAEPFTPHVSQLKRLMMLTNGYEIMVTAIL